MTDSLFGVVWKLNKGPSTFSLGVKPDEETRECNETRNGYTLDVNGVRNGTPYHWGYTAAYDGRDHPVHGRADADVIEAHKINDKKTIGIFKKGGKSVALYARGVENGALEVLTSGVDAGAAYFDVIHYTKD